MREKECLMIPYEIDPSLHDAEPASGVLDDGFSPPSRDLAVDDAPSSAPAAPVTEPRP
jgi:hypothetical protein